MNQKNTRYIYLPHLINIANTILFFASLILLLLCTLAAEVLTVTSRKSTGETPQTYGMRYEEVTLSAQEDGLEIAAWYIPVEGQSPEQVPAIVMVHGWTASRTVGFNQHFLQMAQELHKSGMAVMMIDLRGHGESEAAHVSFGVYERRDVLAAIDELLRRGHPESKIGLLGTSMGAASVVGAAAEHPAVGAVVTDSLFADIHPVLEGQWRAVSGLPPALLQVTLGMFKAMNGYELTASRPIDEIAQLSGRPLMMIHCQADNLIPLEQFQRLQQAAPWAETWLVEECQHAEIYEYVAQEYSQKVVGFFEAGLQPGRALVTGSHPAAGEDGRCGGAAAAMAG